MANSVHPDETARYKLIYTVCIGMILVAGLKGLKYCKNHNTNMFLIIDKTIDMFKYARRLPHLNEACP